MADIVFAGETAGGRLNENALPANNDLVIYKGDYVRLLLTVKDAAGQPLNLTGATAKAVLKSDYSDRDPKPFTCTIATPANGQVVIFLSSSVTSLLLPGSYIWDFQITFSDGETRTYLAGDVTVYNEVTT